MKNIEEKILYRVAGFFLFFMISSASFLGFYVKYHFREADPAQNLSEQRYSLNLVLDGTASRPFIYRQLIPMIANQADRLTPQPIQDKLYATFTGRHDWLRELYPTPLGQDHNYFLRYSVVYLLSFASALLSTWAMFLLLRRQNFDLLVSLLAAFAVILLLPYFMTVGSYYYDYPELAFMSLSVYLALRSQWRWLILLALFATWNKESYLFFVPCLYPLLRKQSSRQQALLITTATGLISAAVMFTLHALYAYNPGGTTEFHLGEQIAYLLHPWRWIPQHETTYGIPLEPNFILWALVLAVLLVRSGWSSLSLPLRRFTLLATAINLPLFLLFCNEGELRNLSFLYLPLLFLIAVFIQKAQTRSLAKIQPEN